MASLFQDAIYFVGYRFTPLVGTFLARDFNCEMREPLRRSGTVPMLNPGRDVNAVARLHLYGFSALFLIISVAADAHKNLSAATLCVMYMPVVCSPAQKLH